MRRLDRRVQEERSRAKELQELRRDNRKLRKQVLRLQKQLVRLQNQEPFGDSPSPEPEETSPPRAAAVCSVCGGPLKTLTLPTGMTLVGCTKCKSSRRI